MVGNNVLILNQLTVELAIQEYLNRNLIKEIKVLSVAPKWEGECQVYTVYLESPKIDIKE